MRKLKWTILKLYLSIQWAKVRGNLIHAQDLLFFPPQAQVVFKNKQIKSPDLPAIEVLLHVSWDIPIKKKCRQVL